MGTKNYWLSLLPSLLIAGLLAVAVHADPPSGGDASNSMSLSDATIISTGTFTADLGPGDTTDMYKITVTAGLTLAASVTSTDTADAFDYISLNLWYLSVSSLPAITTYLYPTSSFSMFTSNVISGSGYVPIGFFLTGTRCHYNFTVTLTVQNDAGTGADVLNRRSQATVIFDGNYTGYVDGADMIDYYRFTAVESFNLTIDASTASGLAMQVVLYRGYTFLERATISSNSSAQLTYLTTETSTEYYIKILETSGSGAYSFSLASEANLTYDPGGGSGSGYLCVIPYPNPFDVSKNHTKITFEGSGVPNGKIRIFTFDGKLVKTLEETGGSSSFEWYPLQDDIPSGIYLYSTENPAEKNIGKITIIR